MRKVIIVFLISNLLVFGGCLTLRKKFIRKKKPKLEPTVYVDFKQYPEYPSQEVYQLYYVFAQGWLDELIKALNYTGNRKKQKQAITEVINNVEQMLGFFDEEGKKETEHLYQELIEVKDKLYSIQLNKIIQNQLLKKVERIKREFPEKFSWKNVSPWIK
jgi:hypothetical protein